MVVLDRVEADVQGGTVSGSLDCTRQACTRASDPLPGTVQVRTSEGFGSLQPLTEVEWVAQRPGDAGGRDDRPVPGERD